MTQARLFQILFEALIDEGIFKDMDELLFFFEHEPDIVLKLFKSFQ